MTRLILIGLGGAIGSICRYLLSGFAQGLTTGSFPVGTLAVNAAGCFIIGGLSELAETRSVLTPETRALVIVGFLGGFTTFSTFGNETVNLLRDRDLVAGMANVILHLVLAVGAVWLGRAAANLIWH